MRLPDVEYPPLSSGSSASLDEWFTITREDLGVTAIGRGSDSDDDFVLVASESQKVVSNVQMVKPTFATVSNETHLAATDVANLIPVEETTLSSDLITPGGALTASSPPPPAVIVLNGRKITAPGFNTDAALAFDDRWIGRDLKARRNNLRWYSSGRRKECIHKPP
ncbi:hypothetical protein CspHIS471_0200190 [Cutaneotrichosporon sp. HIS471]|nr:hypothetical protein CspHIS471_0200190 [Cutaneotrichosporon sp. HIS471]